MEVVLVSVIGTEALAGVPGSAEQELGPHASYTHHQLDWDEVFCAKEFHLTAVVGVPLSG